MVERIASKAWALGLKTPFAMDAMLMSLAGAGEERTGAILLGIGFRKMEKAGVTLYRVPRPGNNQKTDNKHLAAKKTDKTKRMDKQKQPRKHKQPIKQPEIDEDSPFAILKNLTLVK